MRYCPCTSVYYHSLKVRWCTTNVEIYSFLCKKRSDLHRRILSLNQGVPGSSPGRSTKQIPVIATVAGVFIFRRQHRSTRLTTLWRHLDEMFYQNGLLFSSVIIVITCLSIRIKLNLLWNWLRFSIVLCYIGCSDQTGRHIFKAAALDFIIGFM